jgi:hypothetical protein
MYELSLPKLSNFFGKFMDKNMLAYQFVKNLTKIGYYCNYVVIWRKKFQLSLEDSSIFHLSLKNGLKWDI